MKKLLATICAGAVLGLMASCDDAPGKAKAYNQGINIIPTPVSLTQNEGNFKLNKNTKIYASTPEAKTVAEFFAAKMNTATGYRRQRDLRRYLVGYRRLSGRKRRGIHVRRSRQRRPYQSQDPSRSFLRYAIVLAIAARRDRESFRRERYRMDRSGRIYQGRASFRLPWYHARPLPPFHPGREYQEAAGCIGLVQDQPHALAPDRRPRMAY